jgi:ABC-type hemin transport system ATPase subunit
MRIKAIELSWFRGASDTVALDLGGRSMVAYGMNGSGKSSFVDAVEHVLHDGKIEHLAHQYSGRRQEKAIPNTHTPHDQKTALAIRFEDNSELRTAIRRDGSYARSGADAIAMPTWEYRRTVLRQHEVAEFIQSTKGDKYSALLPLLGLHPMELAAENLRQLTTTIERVSKLGEVRLIIREIGARRKAAFGTETDEQILKTIEKLHAKHCPKTAATKDNLARCKELTSALDTRIEESSADQRRYVGLQDVAALDLKGQIDAVRDASAKLAGAAEPLIAEKLEILQATGTFTKKLGDETEVICPACGRAIPVDAFQAHVKAEKARLREIIDTFDTRKTAIGTLCRTVTSLQSTLAKPHLKAWRDELSKGPLADAFVSLDEISTEALRTSCGDADLMMMESSLLALIDTASSASKDAPPDAKQLSSDKRTVEAAGDVFGAKDRAIALQRAEALAAYVKSLEHGTREEIRRQAIEVVNDISADIQRMWAILHPERTIDHVGLYLPETDKAIDIRLRFHGIAQDSPRLTLSEGYRNGLGLCIFLAMAKRESSTDRPLFLDDVVVSLDRIHRGMIAGLLDAEFGSRQVVILTHDREWFTELRHQLDGKRWRFRILLPYETPAIGIRWSHKTTTFDDARAHLKDRPDSAGNDARKIMDVELALVAERLKIRVPFLRGDKNDRRMAYDFAQRLTSDGKTCFEKRSQQGYETYAVAINAIDDAGKLLVSWGNRASHSHDLVRPEAQRLIDTCETALEYFRCPSCSQYVWYTDAARPKLVQCQCGEIRWRYGKG